MGMATPQPSKKIEPVADNLVVCGRCSAQYDPTLDWVLMKYEGTSSYGKQVMAIPDNRCPICLAERAYNINT